MIKITKPDGSVTTNIYDSKQRLVSSIEKTSSGTVISGFEYAFDAMGRLSYEKNLAKQIKVCYTYDVLSRVIQRKAIKLSDNSEVIETYSYNSAGNLCTACGNESFRYDANNKLTEFGGKPAILVMHKRLILLNCNTGLKSANCGLQAGNSQFCKQAYSSRNKILHLRR